MNAADINAETKPHVETRNKMGYVSEGRLLFGMGAPLAVSMMIQALYNIVDSVFVSYLGENALTAITLSFPIFMLMISVAVGTGVGMNSLISRKLGAKQHGEAERAASNGFFVIAAVLCPLHPLRDLRRAPVYSGVYQHPRNGGIRNLLSYDRYNILRGIVHAGFSVSGFCSPREKTHTP